MSARDELSGTLSNTICNASNYTKRAQPYLLGSDMSDVLDKTADAILAAGYRKPRTITTADEVDALPDGAVVVSFYGYAGTVLDSVRRHKSDAYHFLVKYGPATVLHEGGTK